MNAKGKVFKYGDNVDTDVIIPARYLNIADPKELSTHAMEDIDADFVKNMHPGDIVVATRNFGCGSSREHAPLVLRENGVSCVIASSFARIFYRNAINIGLPILECEAAANGIDAGDEVEVDFDTGVITDVTKGESWQAAAFPPFIQNIIKAGGRSSRSRRERHNPMEYNIAVVKGDGIGPEIVSEAMLVLDKVGEKFGHKFGFQEVLAGGCSIDKNGIPLTDETIEICKNADSVLLGAVGGPKWDDVPSAKRPEKALLGLRAALGLFVNLRPAQMHKALADACPIKPEIIGDGFDILVCRELTGDVYFGKHYRRESDKGWGETGADDMNYSVYEVERIGRRAFEMAMKRNKKVCSVDKANVLETSRVWRETMHRIKDEYPEVEYTDMYVDNCAMQLVRNPGQFDVIVTGNLFGDILSDEASMITGSIGMLPSASMNESGKGMYEPIHGSAPDIAGKGIANPIATILSCAMMLRYSFGLKDEADAIETAVENVLNAGHRTADIAAKGEKVLSTSEMGALIREQL